LAGRKTRLGCGMSSRIRTIGPKPLTFWIIEQLRLSLEVDEILIATVEEEVNRPLQKWADKEGVSCFWYEGETDYVTTRCNSLYKYLVLQYGLQ